MQSDSDTLLLEPDESLPSFFDRVAALHSARKAFGCGIWQPTFYKLNTAANRIADQLIGLGVERGDRVAILMPHDTPLIAAMLAVLKAGSIVVVLNPAEPVARQKQILSIAEASVVVADASSRSAAEDLAGGAGKILVFEDVDRDGGERSPDFLIDPDETAFLVFTSGSTGLPKAVMQTHRQVLQKVGRLFHGVHVGPDDRIALLAALSGGQGIGTAWCALANGATLCPFPVMERGFSGLAEWIDHEQITIYLSSASLFRNLVKTLPADAVFSEVRAVMIASEPATSDDFHAFRRHFAEGCAFVHMLSSSETGNIARLFLSHRDVVREGRLPVGLPARGIDFKLVDGRGQEVPRGETGELLVRSRYLSAGYWRDPDLTAQRFSEPEPGSAVQVFRSGDVGRINDDGLLEFAGRNDARMKIRGYRIDPDDIEDALQFLPGVERAAVGLLEREAREPLLVAHVVLKKDHGRNTRALRQALRARLPRHLVPSLINFVEIIPLTAHGKVDRDKLASVGFARSRENAGPPATSTEVKLGAIWSEALEVEDVGREDDFFELGGDSLIAAIVTAKIYAQLSVELHLGQFVDYPRLTDLATAIDKLIEGGGGRGIETLGRRNPSEIPPQSLLQERIWATSRMPEASARYTVARSYRLVGSIDTATLRAAIGDVVHRHEILRTTFEARDGKPVQIVHPKAELPFPVFDVSMHERPMEEAQAILKSEAASVFDLAHLPLLRFAFIRIRDDEHWLLRVNHGILADGWSWQVFLRDLAAAYGAHLRDEPVSVSAAPSLQYADYAIWQRSAFDQKTPGYLETISWWKRFLGDAPRPAALPFRRDKSHALAGPAEGVIPFSLGPNAPRLLDEIAHKQGATYYAVRIAIFSALLAVETGQSDLMIGGFVTRRNRIELQDMMGLFGNQVRLRLQFSEKQTFRDWLSHVSQVIVDTEAHSQIPYEQLRIELEARGVRLHGFYAFVNIFQFSPCLWFPEFTVEEMDWRSEFMPSAFVMNFSQYNERSDSRLTYDASIYDAAKVRGFIERLGRLFEAVSRNPDLPMETLLAQCGALRPGRLKRFARALRLAS